MKKMSEKHVSRKGAKGAKVRINKLLSLRAWRLGAIRFFVKTICSTNSQRKARFYLKAGATSSRKRFNCPV
jgi:hypothetical protein